LIFDRAHYSASVMTSSAIPQRC